MYYINPNPKCLNNNTYPIDRIIIENNCYSRINGKFHTFIKDINNTAKKNNFNFAIINLKKINNNINFFSKLLSENELKIVHKYKSNKRKIEFTAARILSKILIHRLHNKIQNTNIKEIFKQISITKKENNGAPIILYMGKEEKLNISIAHSYDYVFTAISKNKIGIDIQKINAKIISLKKKYTKEKEEIIINKNIHYPYLWASKEAIAKYCKTSIFHSMKNASLEKINDNIFTFSYLGKNTSLNTYNFNYNDYVFSIALEKYKDTLEK